MSTLTKRAALSGLAGQQFGGKRDIYEICGYPQALDARDYARMYQRNDIAARVVDAYPDATWGEAPEIDVLGWDALDKKHNIMRSLHRLDRLTNMGHYGILVLGLDGGEAMHLPADRSDYGLLYLQPHSERTADIIRWDIRPDSPRFGQPFEYNITTGINWTGSGGGERTMRVHHSRVIHVAERAQEDISIGTPRLERIWNRMIDLDKLLGGGAEIYWQNAAQIIAFKAAADTEFDPASKADMEEQFEEMQHGLRRMLRLRGVEPQQIAAGLMGSDPSNLISSELDFIAGATGIPKRILIGSERGELASSQDETAWSNRIMERREQHASPNIIEPLINRLQSLGVVQKAPFEVTWADEDTLGEETRATIAKIRAETLTAYNNGLGNDSIVTPLELREMLGLDGPLPTMPVELPIDESDDQVQSQFRRVK